MLSLWARSTRPAKKKNIHSLWEWWSDRGRMASALTHRWRWAGEDRNAAGDTERDWRSLHGAADKTSPARADGSAHDSNDRRLKMITAAPTARFTLHPVELAGGRRLMQMQVCGNFSRAGCGIFRLRAGGTADGRVILWAWNLAGDTGRSASLFSAPLTEAAAVSSSAFDMRNVVSLRTHSTPWL